MAIETLPQSPLLITRVYIHIKLNFAIQFSLPSIDRYRPHHMDDSPSRSYQPSEAVFNYIDETVASFSLQRKNKS